MSSYLLHFIKYDIKIPKVILNQRKGRLLIPSSAQYLYNWSICGALVSQPIQTVSNQLYILKYENKRNSNKEIYYQVYCDTKPLKMQPVKYQNDSLKVDLLRVDSKLKYSVLSV